MGVVGLLPLLKPIIRTSHIRDVKGKRVAVDASCWMV